MARRFDIFQLLHQDFIDVEPTSGVDDNQVVSVILGIFQGLGGDGDGVRLSHLEDLCSGFFADDL